MIAEQLRFSYLLELLSIVTVSRLATLLPSPSKQSCLGYCHTLGPDFNNTACDIFFVSKDKECFVGSTKEPLPASVIASVDMEGVEVFAEPGDQPFINGSHHVNNEGLHWCKKKAFLFSFGRKTM